MKFTIATIFTLALAMSVECSVIGLGPHLGLGWGHAPHASVAIHAATPWAHGVHVASPWLGVSHDIGHGGWHGDWLGHSAAVVVDHGHLGHHEGSYVAKTRGAVHAAPLAGHISSAAAINVAPAPGTV